MLPVVTIAFRVFNISDLAGADRTIGVQSDHPPAERCEKIIDPCPARTRDALNGGEARRVVIRPLVLLRVCTMVSVVFAAVLIANLVGAIIANFHSVIWRSTEHRARHAFPSDARRRR